MGEQSLSPKIDPTFQKPTYLSFLKRKILDRPLILLRGLLYSSFAIFGQQLFLLLSFFV